MNFIQFEKWHAFRASVGGMRGLNSWRASVNDMSAWATWVVSQHGCVCVGGVDGVLR